MSKRDNGEEAPVEGLTPGEAVERLRKFLEDWPLYRHLELTLEESLRELGFPASLSMRCPFCKDEPSTTWQKSSGAAFFPGEVVEYTCGHCTRQKASFWVRVTRSRSKIVRPVGGNPYREYFQFDLRKIGQWPP